jgi:hypothetical protein
LVVGLAIDGLRRSKSGSSFYILVIREFYYLKNI